MKIEKYNPQYSKRFEKHIRKYHLYYAEIAHEFPCCMVATKKRCDKCSLDENVDIECKLRGVGVIRKMGIICERLDNIVKDLPFGETGYSPIKQIEVDLLFTEWCVLYSKDIITDEQFYKILIKVVNLNKKRLGVV